MKKIIRYTNLDDQWNDIRDESLKLIDKILSTGKYIEHELIVELEQLLAEKVGSKHVILVNSGTDALLLSLRFANLQKGDEVITVPNSFIATAAAIDHVGGVPVFVDVGEDHLIDCKNIEDKINYKTKIIMPVHLEGKVCDLEKINTIAKVHNLNVIEDSAQSFGSKLNEKTLGYFGNISCYSLHPLKNLNIAGDGGFIALNDDHIADNIKAYRNHGQTQRNNSQFFGVVSRFDSIQAAILKCKLTKFDQYIEKRRNNAKQYDKNFQNSKIKVPTINANVFHTYHLYVIEVENRDKIQLALADDGIETRIHYPKLISEQMAFKRKFKSQKFLNAEHQKNRILSLPIHTSLVEDDLNYVSDRVLHYVEKFN